MADLIAPALIPAKVRPQVAAGRSGRPVRRPPLAPLAPVRGRTSIYAAAAVDDRGRVIAHPVLRSLGWSAGTAVSLRVVAGLIVVTADPAGPGRITPAGDLRIPATIRCWCGLTPGCRVLLVANPDRQRLVLHPPASLDAMINREYAAVFGGDAG